MSFLSPTGDWRFLWKALALIAGAMLVSVLATAALILAATVAFSARLPQAEALAQAETLAAGLPAQTAIAVLSLAGLLGAAYLLVTRVEKRRWDWAALGLGPAGRGRGLLGGALAAGGIVALVATLQLLTGVTRLARIGLTPSPAGEPALTLALALILALASAFAEEIAFRGYLQTRLLESQPAWIAVPGVAALFALAHPVPATEPALYLAQALAVGVLFGLVFWRTGSLWPGMALHAVWNFIKTGVVVTQNAADGRFQGMPLFVLQDLQPGAAMLIELAVILAAIGVALALRRHSPAAQAALHDMA